MWCFFGGVSFEAGRYAVWCCYVTDKYQVTPPYNASDSAKIEGTRPLSFNKRAFFVNCR